MTCHHVLPSLSEAQESDIYFGRTSDDDDNSTQYTGTIIKGDELFDSSYFKTDTVEVCKLASTDFLYRYNMLCVCISYYLICTDTPYMHRLMDGEKDLTTLL